MLLTRRQAPGVPLVSDCLQQRCGYAFDERSYAEAGGRAPKVSVERR